MPIVDVAGQEPEDISEPKQADTIVRRGQADLVLLAHAMLDDPQWAYHAAKALEVPDSKWTLPAPYAHWIRTR